MRGYRSVVLFFHLWECNSGCAIQIPGDKTCYNPEDDEDMDEPRLRSLYNNALDMPVNGNTAGHPLAVFPHDYIAPICASFMDLQNLQLDVVKVPEHAEGGFTGCGSLQSKL